MGPSEIILRFEMELSGDPELALLAQLVMPQLRALGSPQLVVEACDRLERAWRRAKGDR